VIWQAITDTTTEVVGDHVILRKNDNQFFLNRIISNGEWSITDAKPPST